MDLQNFIKKFKKYKMSYHQMDTIRPSTRTYSQKYSRTYPRNKTEFISEQPIAFYPSEFGRIEREESHPEHHGLIIGTIAIIILIVLGVGALLYFFMQNEQDRMQRLREEKIGTSCTTQAECGTVLYCDGNGICVSGSGEAEGESCSRDSNCLFGLECINMKCVSSTAANNIVGSETNFALGTVLNGAVHYLLINEMGSFLIPMIPQEYSLDYTSTKEELVFQSTNTTYENQGVIVNGSGNLTISRNPDRLLLQRLSNGGVQLVHPCGSVLSFVPLTTNGTTPPFRAFFPQIVNGRTCPSTWGSPTNATQLTFNIVELLAPI